MESPAAAADFISVPLSNLSAKAGVTDRSSGVGSVDTGTIATTSSDRGRMGADAADFRTL